MAKRKRFSALETLGLPKTGMQTSTASAARDAAQVGSSGASALAALFDLRPTPRRDGRDLEAIQDRQALRDVGQSIQSTLQSTAALMMSEKRRQDDRKYSERREEEQREYAEGQRRDAELKREEDQARKVWLSQKMTEVDQRFQNARSDLANAKAAREFFKANRNNPDFLADFRDATGAVMGMVGGQGVSDDQMMNITRSLAESSGMSERDAERALIALRSEEMARATAAADTGDFGMDPKTAGSTRKSPSFVLNEKLWKPFEDAAVEKIKAHQFAEKLMMAQDDRILLEGREMDATLRAINDYQTNSTFDEMESIRTLSMSLSGASPFAEDSDGNMTYGTSDAWGDDNSKLSTITRSIQSRMAGLLTSLKLREIPPDQFVGLATQTVLADSLAAWPDIAPDVIAGLQGNPNNPVPTAMRKALLHQYKVVFDAIRSADPEMVVKESLGDLTREMSDRELREVIDDYDNAVESVQDELFWRISGEGEDPTMVYFVGALDRNEDPYLMEKFTRRDYQRAFAKMFDVPLEQVTEENINQWVARDPSEPGEKYEMLLSALLADIGWDTTEFEAKPFTPEEREFFMQAPKALLKTRGEEETHAQMADYQSVWDGLSPSEREEVEAFYKRNRLPGEPTYFGPDSDHSEIVDQMETDLRTWLMSTSARKVRPLTAREEGFIRRNTPQKKDLPARKGKERLPSKPRRRNEEDE